MVKTLLAIILATTWIANTQAADLRDVQNVLEKYQSVRDQASNLTIYQCDWALTLHEAKQRAAAEERPIFFIIVVNSYGNILSGHC